MFSTTHPEGNDDALLMRRLAAGDEEAFNRLFERHRGKLYDYLVKVTRSAEISEEIVTDVFVKLWIGKELVTEIRQLDAFLHTVAYHKALDFLRTVSRKRRMHKTYLESFQPEPEKSADELLIDAESLQLFKRAVQTLPPKRKLIYTMSREKGLTHEEIARALNLSPNTVKNSIVTATRVIGEFLHEHHAGKAALGVLFLLC
jgi:RNA polymerase sigma-70 factor (ECF subfamily)